MNHVSDSNNNVVEQSKVKLPGKIIIVNVRYTFPYISLGVVHCKTRTRILDDAMNFPFSLIETPSK